MERRRASREREEGELRAKQEVITEKQKRVSGYSLLYVSSILTHGALLEMWWRHNQINLTSDASPLFRLTPSWGRGRSQWTDRGGWPPRRRGSEGVWGEETFIWAVSVAGCGITGCWTVQNTDILMSWIIWITYYRIGRLSTVWQKPWSQECHYDQDDISDQGHHNIPHQDGKSQ